MTQGSRLSVWHVLPGAGIGGTELSVLRLSVAERARGHDSRVIVLKSTGALLDRFAAAKIPVRTGGSRLPSLFLSRAPWRGQRPDVVMGWLYWGNLMAAHLVRRGEGLLWNVLQSNLDPAVNSLASRWALRRSVTLSRGLPDRIICNSPAAWDSHVRAGYPLNKMRLIPNGVDVDRFRPAPAARYAYRERLGLLPSAFVLGHLARWDPQKDHRTFIRAVGRACAHGWPGFVLMGGPGIDASNKTLTAWIQDCGATSRIRLLGSVDDAPAFFSALDVACLSSVGESSSYALAEAMACGVPCVATDVGDARDTLGETGRIVPPGNPESMARALLDLTAMTGENRARLASDARQRIAERMSFERLVCRYEDLYSEIMMERSTKQF